jgi:thioredoxin 1
MLGNRLRQLFVTVSMSTHVTEINSPEDLAKLLKENEHVLVDFWAAWCGPCRKVGPIVDQIADERQGSLAVAKLNVDEQPELAQLFRVSSIPTLIAFKDGELAKRMIGAKPKAALEDDLVSAFGS